MAIKRADLRKIFSDTDTVSDEQITRLFNLIHGETNSLRDEIDSLNTQLEESRKASGNDEDQWKSKYEKEHEDFEEYKKQNAMEVKRSALMELLKGSGILDEGIEKALKYADYEGIEIGEDGNIKGADDILKSIKDEWVDYMPVIHGQEVECPPSSGSKSFEHMTLEEKMAYANANPGDPQVMSWLNS